MYLIENDPSLWAFGLTTVPYSRYSLKQFIDQSQNDIFLDGQLRLVIEASNADALGFIDLQGLEPRHRRAEVGIVLLPGSVCPAAFRAAAAYCHRRRKKRTCPPFVPASRLYLSVHFASVA